MATKNLPDAAYLRECLSYDPETGVLTWKHRPREHFPSHKVWRNWNNRFAGNPAGGVKTPWGYMAVHLNAAGSCQVHRIAWKIQTNEDPPSGLDHINRDPADNRWSNLRLATPGENTSNSVRRGRLLPKGVTQNHRGYVARCGAGGRVFNLGTFPTPELAHAAYCVFAAKAHREFFYSGTANVHREKPTPRAR